MKPCRIDPDSIAVFGFRLKSCCWAVMMFKSFANQYSHMVWISLSNMGLASSKNHIIITCLCYKGCFLLIYYRIRTQKWSNINVCVVFAHSADLMVLNPAPRDLDQVVWREMDEVEDEEWFLKLNPDSSEKFSGTRCNRDILSSLRHSSNKHCSENVFFHAHKLKLD